jgi:adenine-specific DNA-methyltransferase
MIEDRLRIFSPFLSKKGVIFSSIDEVERNSLERALDSVFGRESRVEELIWAKNTNKNQSPTYSTNHEYGWWTIRRASSG